VGSEKRKKRIKKFGQMTKESVEAAKVKIKLLKAKVVRYDLYSVAEIKDIKRQINKLEKIIKDGTPKPARLF